jgi:hypothetical protein
MEGDQPRQPFGNSSCPSAAWQGGSTLGSFRSSLSDSNTELAQPAVEDLISANGSIGRVDRVSTVGVDFAAHAPISPENAHVGPTGPALVATNGSQGNNRNGVGSPLDSQRARPVIEMSNTTASRAALAGCVNQCGPRAVSA